VEGLDELPQPLDATTRHTASFRQLLDGWNPTREDRPTRVRVSHGVTLLARTTRRQRLLMDTPSAHGRAPGRTLRPLPPREL